MSCLDVSSASLRYFTGFTPGPNSSILLRAAAASVRPYGAFHAPPPRRPSRVPPWPRGLRAPARVLRASAAGDFTFAFTFCTRIRSILLNRPLPTGNSRPMNRREVVRSCRPAGEQARSVCVALRCREDFDDELSVLDGSRTTICRLLRGKIFCLNPSRKASAPL